MQPTCTRGSVTRIVVPLAPSLRQGGVTLGGYVPLFLLIRQHPPARRRWKRQLPSHHGHVRLAKSPVYAPLTASSATNLVASVCCVSTPLTSTLESVMTDVVLLSTRFRKDRVHWVACVVTSPRQQQQARHQPLQRRCSPPPHLSWSVLVASRRRVRPASAPPRVPSATT